MRSDSAQPRFRNNAAAPASIVALMAIAMAVTAVQGASLTGLPEQVQGMREASTARAVAAAVTAAVRDMVGHDTIDASVVLECADSFAWLPQQASSTIAWDDVGRSHAPPIAPRLLNIPPPTN
jgi:hypothetical protein